MRPQKSDPNSSCLDDSFTDFTMCVRAAALKAFHGAEIGCSLTQLLGGDFVCTQVK